MGSRKFAEKDKTEKERGGKKTTTTKVLTQLLCKKSTPERKVRKAQSQTGRFHVQHGIR